MNDLQSPKDIKENEKETLKDLDSFSRNDPLNDGFIDSDDSNDESDDEEGQLTIKELSNPNISQTQSISKLAKKKSRAIKKNLMKICVAPGEDGKFMSWSKDIFFEEMCFVEKFPFGTGGYISSVFENPEHDIGFAK